LTGAAAFCGDSGTWRWQMAARIFKSPPGELIALVQRGRGRLRSDGGVRGGERGSGVSPQPVQDVLPPLGGPAPFRPPFPFTADDPPSRS
jgi:hypothetical protein